MRTIRSLPVWAAALSLAAASAALAMPRAGASSTPQLGFNTYIPELCESTTTWQNDAVGQFTALKSLGANSIALAFPIYTSGLRASSVFARHQCGTTYQTPSPQRLAVPIEIAHSMHLRVFLRPIIDEVILRKEGGWRGALRPRSISTWFRSYQATLTPYLRLAQQQHVEYFAISTELASLDLNSHWTSLIRSVKRIYKGTLVFTGVWRPKSMAQHSGTATGLDTYQGVVAPTTATVAQLLAGWNAAATQSDPIPFPLSSASIDEVAILAQDGAYPVPWAWTLPLKTFPFDENIQANWYTMVCQFFQTHHMQGIYFWGVDYVNGAGAVLTSPDASYPQSIQPAAAQAIKTCYTG